MAEPTMADLMLQAARRDAVAFFKLVGDAEVHDSIIGFHAQQAVEKALKAVLFRHKVLVPRTHKLDELVDALQASAIAAPPHTQAFDELNAYAVQARYGTLEVGPLDRDLAGEWVRDVLVWVSAFRSG